MHIEQNTDKKKRKMEIKIQKWKREKGPSKQLYIMQPSAPTATTPSLKAPELSRAEKAALKHAHRSSLGSHVQPAYSKPKPAKSKSALKNNKNIKPRPGCERLYADAKNRRESLEKKRQSLDTKYSFVPKITNRGKTSSPTNENKGIKRTDLLYQDAIKRKAHQEELSKQLTPTFKPQLSKVSAKRTQRGNKIRKPLYSANKTKEREEARRLIRERLENEKQAEINSTRIPRQKYKSNNKEPQPNGVVARMALAAEKSKLYHLKLKSQNEKKKLEETSFQPNLSKSSPRAGSNVGGTSTFDRLYKGAAEKKERLIQMQKQKEEASSKDLTFRPKIRDKDGTLHLAKIKHNNNKWINQQLQEGTLKLKAKKEAATYKQCYEEREILAQREELTFQPSITSPLTSPESSPVHGIEHEKEILVVDELAARLAEEKNQHAKKEAEAEVNIDVEVEVEVESTKVEVETVVAEEDVAAMVVAEESQPMTSMEESVVATEVAVADPVEDTQEEPVPVAIAKEEETKIHVSSHKKKKHKKHKNKKKHHN